MISVKTVIKEIMMHGYDPHKEPLDVIVLPDTDDGIGNGTVRFIQGFTRATCAITILTCAIQVLKDNPELVHESASTAPILESCVNLMCNFRAVEPERVFYEMLSLPGVFPCGADVHHMLFLTLCLRVISCLVCLILFVQSCVVGFAVRQMRLRPLAKRSL
jgi:hypothetical protein